MCTWAKPTAGTPGRITPRRQCHSPPSGHHVIETYDYPTKRVVRINWVFAVERRNSDATDIIQNSI